MLTAQGYNCITPQMQYSDAPTPTPSIAPDIAYLQTLIAAETSAGKNVILVGHSFGGVASSSCVKGFTAADPSNLKQKTDGKVIGIALLTAMCIPTGSSLAAEYMTDAPGEAQHDNIAMPENGDVTSWCVLLPGLDPIHKFYNDLPRDEAKLWVSRLHKQSFPALLTEGTSYGGWLDVPLFYLVCEQDTTFTGPFQERMVRRAQSLGAKVTVSKIDAGHSPFLSKPKETAEFLVEAAEALGR